MVVSTCNSSRTNRLLQRAAGQDPLAPAELFARHRERLRRIVRLRLDHRLRGRLRSSAVLDQVYRDVCGQLPGYLADPGRPFFLWLRQVAGRRLQELHRHYLGDRDEAPGAELHLGRGALPPIHSASLAAQLLGDRAAGAARRAEMLLRLQEALNGLDPLDREVLALCHFEDLSEDEAAAVLGMERPALTARYLGALDRLGDILRGIPGFFDPRGQ